MKSKNGKTLKIGLLDHMGYGNLGDAATQDVAIANIRRRLPDAQLVGFSFVPADTTMRHGIPCHPIRSWHPTPTTPGNAAAAQKPVRPGFKSLLKRFPPTRSLGRFVQGFFREAVFWVSSYRVVRHLDLLIISGGGQLTDLWRGPWSHPFAIFRFCLLTKLAGKKLYFLNVGAGPLDHRLSKMFARFAVQLADYRSFRDDDSEKLVRSLGVKAKTYVYPDLVYGLEVEELQRDAQHPPTRVVGINAIGYCDPRCWARKDEKVYSEYLEKVVSLCVWLLENDYRLRMFTTEKSLDQYVMEDLKTLLHTHVSPQQFDQIDWGASDHVKDVLREISGFDFVVTSKFHGIIFSHLLGKPVISLSYGRKMDFAMRAVGQSRFNANIERFNVDWFIETFSAMAADRENISRQSGEAVKAYATRLAEQFDGLFLVGTP